ncbi:hypothetical protein ACGFX4_36930 [Kitasatospora sp. NPDC048365]|uniref:hypothetical protein n=1 Tax=Kitasatospora sp. NPDC048365 TaxID=3364050 RepID=UPI0037182816
MTASPTRPDLLALSPDTLAALTNRGLVKRAAKEVDAGTGPELAYRDDDTVLGVHPDGSRTCLPAGAALDGATCSCGAAGVCRHTIGLVLAHQRHSAAAPEPDPAWSPADFDDAQLAAAFGRAAMAAARRAFERGYRATVHRAGGATAVPWVELPTCTVRFPVPRELGYALSDAAPARAGETVVLAVWAFRAATADGPLSIGGPAATAAPAPAPASNGPDASDGPDTSDAPDGRGRTGELDEALALARDLLLDGVTRTTPVFAAQLTRAADDLSRAALHWPAAALGELRDQVAWGAARDARYEPAKVAALLAELHARHLAAVLDRPGALGTREPAQTPLRRTRLVALGCRITGRTALDRTAELYFAQPDAGIVLVMRRQWQLTDGRQPTGADLATRRLLGHPLHALATANVVSEQISRSPGRTVTIGRGRVAATSVTPVGAAWADLPDTVLVRDAAAHLDRWSDRPPRLVRPRVEADHTRVLAVSAVESLGYDAAAQRLEAVVRDAAGNAVLVCADHEPAAPGRLDTLAEALGSGHVSHLSGFLRREGGRPVLDPLAVLTPDGPTVPDLAPATASPALTPAPRHTGDPITTALESALATLADLTHAGLRHADPTRLAAAATALRTTGLTTAAGLLDAITPRTPDTWADAAVHLLTALDLHHETGADHPRTDREDVTTP